MYHNVIKSLTGEVQDGHICVVNKTTPTLTSDPYFLQAPFYTVSPEEGPRSSPTLLTRIIATDLDQTAPQNAITGFANAEIKFSISEGNTTLFSIDEVCLNYEFCLTGPV